MVEFLFFFVWLLEFTETGEALTEMNHLICLESSVCSSWGCAMWSSWGYAMQISVRLLLRSHARHKSNTPKCSLRKITYGSNMEAKSTGYDVFRKISYVI